MIPLITAAMLAANVHQGEPADRCLHDRTTLRAELLMAVQDWAGWVWDVPAPASGE